MRADLTDGRAPRSIAPAQVRGEPALLGQESRHAQRYWARPDIAQVPVTVRYGLVWRTETGGGVRQGVHPDDVALCLEVDRFPFAMVAVLEGSLMVLRPRATP